VKTRTLPLLLFTLALAMLATTAASAAIPLTGPTIGRLVPLGDGPDGEKAHSVWVSILTLDYQVTQEPESIPDLFDDPVRCLRDVARFALANLRADILVYPDPLTGEDDYCTDLAVSAQLASDGSPFRIGFLYAPFTEWDKALYGDLDILGLAGVDTSPDEATSLSLGPTYRNGELGLGFVYRKEFR